MNNMQKYVERNLKHKANKFLDYKEARSSLGSEKRTTTIYDGRQLFELLQNADDEMTADCDKSIKIVYLDNTLEVLNNGRVFSEDGIDSLMYQDSSPKSQYDLEEIGCKGLGFRSVLSWANEITIDSGDLHIKFSEDIAQKQLEKYMGNEYNKTLKASTLEFPIWNDKFEKCEYTTRINLIIKNKDNIKKDISDQIKALDAELLLFLNHTEKLIIETKNSNIEYEKKINEKDKRKVILIKKENSKITRADNWHIISDTGEGIDEEKKKRYKVSIAYKEDGTYPYKRVIYSYFPTKLKLDYPFLVHATFELNDNRNNLVKKDINKDIAKLIAKLMVKQALQISKKKYGYDALWMLLAHWNFPQDLIDCNIEEFLKKEIASAKLLPSVNRKYISIKDHPIYDKHNLGDYVSGIEFDNLVLNYDNFVENAEKSKYANETTFEDKYEELNLFNEWEEKDLIAKVNKYIGTLKIDSNGKRKISHIVLKVYDICSDIDEEIKSDKFYFIVNEKNKLLNCSKDSFVNDDKIIPERLDFIKYNFIDSKYFEYLNDAIEDSYDTVDEVLSWLKIKHANLESMLETIYANINNEIEKGKFDAAHNQTTALIKWLWSIKTFLYEHDKINILFPTREGNLFDSSGLYYGRDYGNELIENLLVSVEEDTFAAKINDILEVNESDTKELIKFIEHLKINALPKKYGERDSFATFQWTNDDEEDYSREYCKELVKTLPENYSKLNRSNVTFENRQQMLRQIVFYVSYTAIEYLPEILNNAKTKHILDWINKDEELKDLLYKEKFDPVLEKHKKDIDIKNSVYFGVKFGNMYDPEKENKLSKVVPYTRHLFNMYKWIEIDNCRYKLSDLILDSEYGSLFAPSLVSINIYDYVDSNSKQKNRLLRIYKEIFSNLGVVDNINRLSYEKIYEILCLLPKVDIKGKYAQTIYNCLINGDKKFDEKQIGDFGYYQKFKDGKAQLFTYNNGYVINSNVKYLTSTSEISGKIKNKYNLICLPPRKNIELIKNIFKIDKININGSVVGTPKKHEYANDFAEYFRLFKYYAYCFKIDSINDEKTIRNYCDLKITLCSEILADYSNEVIELDDYEYISDKGNYYIKFPEDNKVNFSRNRKLSKVVADILCNFFNAYSENEKYMLLFQCLNESEMREYILEHNSDNDIFIRTRNKLNIVGSTKDQFRDLLLYIATDAEPNSYEKYIDLIDFERINDEKNVTPIINCFKSANKDLEDYNNQRPEIEINFIPYYKKMVEDIKCRYKNAYNTRIYNNLINDSISNKKTFMDLINEFDDINIEIVNSIYFNPEDAVASVLNVDKNCFIDLNTVYFNNENEWIKDKEEKELAKEIAKQNEWHSLLYFGEFTYLDEVYNEQLNVINNKETISNKNSSTLISDFVEIDTAPIAKGEKQRKKTRIPKSVGYPSSQNRDNKETGKKGERIVYETFKKLGKNIQWVSEYAYDEGVNSNGRAGLGYDMYIDEENCREFIEVKSSTGSQISFEMTDNEFDFACKNYDHYHIYFVENVNTNHKIKELKDYFNSNGFNEEKASKEISVKYIINAKEK